MIFATGDVHYPIDASKLNTTNWPEQKSLTRDDYLIVCGDMGVVWDGRKPEKRGQAWFEEKPFTTLFVDGNHENHAMLSEYPVVTWNGGKVHQITPHVLHLMRGQVFMIDGLKVFAMGGASSRDKLWRTEGVTWWPEELPSHAEYKEAMENLAEAGWAVDLVVSHCAPDSIQHEISAYYKHDALTNFLETAVRTSVTYRRWVFGHYHKDLDVDNLHTCCKQSSKMHTFSPANAHFFTASF